MTLSGRLCKYVIVASRRLHLDHLIPDKAFLSMYYRWDFDRPLNWKNPTKYSEKLQWLKLYDRQPIYSLLVDKYDVKAHVAEIIGEAYLIPTLGVWDRWEDVDFGSLPEQFVLKCTSDSGSAVIVKDRAGFDPSVCPSSLARSMRTNFYWDSREWPYRSLRPRLIAEPYITDSRSGELIDYKFFCFDGCCKAMFVATGRQSGDVRFDFYDREFNHLDMEDKHLNAAVPPAKPENYGRMVEIAERLSEGFPHVRIDLYNVAGKIYFGEYTFYHWSGFDHFKPASWDDTFGSWLDLGKVRRTR